MSIQKQWRCKLCGWINPLDGRKCIACEKLRPRAKRAKPPAASSSLACVILALDTANVTGWAIRVAGELHGFGEHALYTDTGLERTQRVVSEALSVARSQGLPLVVMSERSWGGHMGRGETKAFGYWLFALRSAGVPLKRILQCYPAEWRAAVLPPGTATARREVARAAEQAHARDAAPESANIGPDAAAAICISEYAARAGEVAALIA